MYEALFFGVNNNKSIEKIEFRGIDLLGGKIFTMMEPFFKNNNNLTNIEIMHCNFGVEQCRALPSALGSINSKSLTKVRLKSNVISEEALADIITALSMQSHIQKIDIAENNLNKNGCMALSSLLSCSANELQNINLYATNMNDEGIDALVPALKMCDNLEVLNINGNPSVTTRGWQHLATILENPNSNIIYIDLTNNNVDNKALATFASRLSNNSSLKRLKLNTDWLSENRSSTESWLVLSEVLCNISSINSTYLSNHTLQCLGLTPSSNPLGHLFDLNDRVDKKDVAMIKILQYHNDFDMMPFFEWEFKVLPHVIKWFERASVIDYARGL